MMRGSRYYFRGLKGVAPLAHSGYFQRIGTICGSKIP